MSTIGRDEIQGRALNRGGNLSWVDLLRSEAVAKRVADKAWDYLVANGYGKRERHHTVQVNQSASHPGTWLVRVLLPGVSLHVPGGREVNLRQRNDAIAALSAAYTNDDLVTSYRLR